MFLTRYRNRKKLHDYYLVTRTRNCIERLPPANKAASASAAHGQKTTIGNGKNTSVSHTSRRRVQLHQHSSAIVMAKTQKNNAKVGNILAQICLCVCFHCLSVAWNLDERRSNPAREWSEYQRGKKVNIFIVISALVGPPLSSIAEEKMRLSFLPFFILRPSRFFLLMQ